MTPGRSCSVNVAAAAGEFAGIRAVPAPEVEHPRRILPRRNVIEAGVHDRDHAGLDR